MISKTRRLRCLSGQTLVSFFRNTQFDALVAWQRDVSFAALTDDEDVVQSSGEKMTKSILNVDNIEGAGVTFTVDDGTDSTQIASAGNHAQIARLELDEILNLAGHDVQLDGIVDLDQGIGVTDGATVMGGEEGDTFGSDLNTLDFAEFVLSFLSSDSVDGKSSLDIVDQTEVLTGLVDGDDIHESSRVVGIGTDFTVDFDQPLHDNFSDLRVVESILKTISQENHHG